MNFLKHNKIIQAFAYLVFVSAVLHMAILAIRYVVTSDIGLFNFFSIIGLNLFYPNFVDSSSGLYVSSFTALGIYLMIYFYIHNKK